MDGHDNPGHDTAGRPRDGGGKFIKTVESAERDMEAARLFSRGRTYQQIADELGYSDKRNAYRAVKEAFATLPAEDVPELRASQMALIAALKAEAIAVLERDHVHISQGGKVVRDDDGKIVLDDGPKLAAINTLDRLLARESLIAGTPMPTRTRLEFSGDAEREDELKEIIRRFRSGGDAQTDGPDGPGS